MAAIRYWIWLSAQTEISPKTKAAIVEHYGDAEQAFFAPAGDYEKIPGVSRRDALRLEKRDLSVADKILADCSAMGIDIITMQDAAYPKLLRDIEDAPVLLYVKGQMPDFESVPAIAVIGTRKASAYGLKMGRALAYEIAKGGGAVISMLSEGIDRSAALGCVQAEGCCIGVLGTGHGADSGFYRDIIRHGALISEYPPNTPSQKHFFRDRNRIASGLSRGVVVVEAPEKSGALLFAAQALEQGREVFAVPGNADAVNSVGTIELIKQGAKPVTCGWDALCEFEYLYPRIRKPEVKPVPPELPAEREEKSAVPAKGSPASAADADLRNQLSGLNEDQLKIISAIDNNDTHIDDIIEKTGMTTAKVLAQLTVLEIKGYVRRSAGRRISLNIKSK